MSSRTIKRFAMLAMASWAWLSVASFAEADLVGYWPLDGDATASVGVDGVLVNGPFPATDRNGVDFGALEFGAGFTAQYVEIPGGGGLDGAQFGTISMWVSWNWIQLEGYPGSFGSVLGRQRDGAFSNNVISLSHDDPAIATVTWRQAGPAAGGPTITGTTPVDYYEWHHIAVAFQPAAAGPSELFVDGVSQGVGMGLPMDSDPTVALTIGAWIDAGNTYSTSTIDDVAIFNDVLSPEQIGELAAQTKTPLDVGPGTVPEIPETPEFLPAAARASSGLGGSFNRFALHVVDGSGMIGTAHDVVPDGAMWLSNGAFAQPNDTDPEIAFDLGAMHTINSMRVWNYNEFLPNRADLLARGVATADILVAGDDQVFTVFKTGQTFAIAPGTVTDFSETIDLGGVTARYVKLDNMRNHGDPSHFVGLSEVGFTGDLIPGQDLPLTASIHEVSSNLAGFDRAADYLLDRSGLYGNTHGIQPETTMWLNQGSFGDVEPADLDPYITFDMGEAVRLDRMEVWNYNEMLPDRPELLQRGVQLADVLVAGEDLIFEPFISQQLFDIGPGLIDVDFNQTIDLGGIEARYVKFENMVNWGGDNDFVGLSEVQFFAVSVPAMAWDGLGDGDFDHIDPVSGNSRWLDPDGNPSGNVPGPDDDALVRTDTVAVSSDQAVGHLAVQDGGVVSVSDQQSLNVGGTDFAEGTVLMLGAGAALQVDGGPARLASVIAADGATISGDAASGGAGSGGIVVAGTISSADGPATLNVDQLLTMQDGSQYAPLIGSTTSDLLETTGDVVIESGSTLQFRISGSDPFKAGDYTLIHSTSEDGMFGEFSDSAGLGSYVTDDGLTYSTRTLIVTIDKDLHPGDADLSGATDLSDFNIWNANKFISGTDWTTGDFDGNGATDLSDFNIWNAAKFTSATGGAAPAPTQVPEPGALALSLGGLLVLWLGRRFKNSRPKTAAG